MEEEGHAQLKQLLGSYVSSFSHLPRLSCLQCATLTSRLQGFPSSFNKLEVVAKACPDPSAQTQLKKGFGNSPPLAPNSEFSVQHTGLDV